MIMVEVIIVFALLFTDMMFTYALCYKTMKLGYKNWWNAERNPIVRYFLMKYGVHKGMRYGASTTIGLVTAIVFILNIRMNWFDFSRIIFFLMGVYAIMNMVHIYTLDQVRQEERKAK